MWSLVEVGGVCYYREEEGEGGGSRGGCSRDYCIGFMGFMVPWIIS